MVIDTFLFNNELDLLEIRLNELKGHVAHHVLVESPFTFSGSIKPLVFADHRSRFSSFDIRYVVVTDMPATTNPWDRESWQRNAILRAFDGAPADTLVLMSDVDEIPRAESIPARVEASELAYFVQSFFYYDMQHRIRGQWRGTRAAQLASVRRWTPQGIRMRGNRPIPNGGWHFSYCASPEEISAKIRAFSHQEYNNPRFNTVDRIRHVVSAGIDLFDRPQMQIEVLNGLDHLPLYVQQNRERFARLIGLQ